ncbi:MAG TPA: VanZ family protein, partial [Burkholderiaceae bacterium]|nr:VanZ family protein [Burkholderiaceae bacterium]
MAERAMSGVELQAWQRRASPFARLAFVVYVVLVVYASLAPWSGWRDLGISAFAYLSAPWPKHVTQFDVIVNVLGYLPFGALGVLAVHPRVRPLLAVAGVALAGVILSGAIEALQTFVPRRIASQVDLLANGVGALAGAWLTAPFAPALIDRGRLLQLRARWFSRHASPLLVLLALWWFAQIYPTPMLFAFGSSDGGLLETARDLGFGLPAR